MHIQWYGHSAFKLTGNGTSLLVDPFLSDNPKFTGTLESAADGVSHILLTHFHNDHFGDALELVRQTGATLVAMVEIADFVAGQVAEAQVIGTNYGGTVGLGDGISVATVPAFHSSSLSLPDGNTVYGGNPAGFVITIEGHRVYHMGDTCLFSDMALVHELYGPDIGIVPIGGHYTMDARAAALAVNRYFRFRTVIPCHFGTFPVLARNADAFCEAVDDAEVVALAPMDGLEF